MITPHYCSIKGANLTARKVDTAGSHAGISSSPALFGTTGLRIVFVSTVYFIILYQYIKNREKNQGFLKKSMSFSVICVKICKIPCSPHDISGAFVLEFQLIKLHGHRSASAESYQF